MSAANGLEVKVRTKRTGFAPVRTFSTLAGAVAVIAAAPVSFPSAAHAATVAVDSGRVVESFYDSRAERPLWLQAGQLTPAAQQLLSLMRSARIDGLDPARYAPEGLDKLLRKAADGNEGAARKADMLISTAFVAYARDLRSAGSPEVKYLDPQLRSDAPSAGRLLQMAAAAPSLETFVSGMGWMNPAYAPLRRALVSGNYDGEKQRSLLRINLQRARALPAGWPRSIVVNAAAQTLYMYEGDRLVDSMKVVVGKQKDNNRTPMMASFVRQASLNPYWNVPPDLAAERIAPNVVKFGLGYLKKHGYQVLSDWSDNPSQIDPATIDWKAVADGTLEVRVRQVPGPGNALGKVKFTFPNPYGVYMHDTPDRELLTEETRLFSGGCIRLEDADRLGEWLFGRELKATSKDPDIPVPLDKPVPVYVTYLTAVPNGSTITYLNDVYGWDAQRLAELGVGGGTVASR